MNWISVKDRLPENEQSVLVCVKRKNYSGSGQEYYKFIMQAFYTDGKHTPEESGYLWEEEYDEKIPKGWWEDCYCSEEFSPLDKDMEVTHWARMPEPPKE